MIVKVLGVRQTSCVIVVTVEKRSVNLPICLDISIFMIINQRSVISALGVLLKVKPITFLPILTNILEDQLICVQCVTGRFIAKSSQTTILKFTMRRFQENIRVNFARIKLIHVTAFSNTMVYFTNKNALKYPLIRLKHMSLDYVQENFCTDFKV